MWLLACSLLPINSSTAARQVRKEVYPIRIESFRKNFSEPSALVGGKFVSLLHLEVNSLRRRMHKFRDKLISNEKNFIATFLIVVKHIFHSFYISMRARVKCFSSDSIWRIFSAFFSSSFSSIIGP